MLNGSQFFEDTENDVNELKAKAASSKNKNNAKSNTTMDYASLRHHAVCSHFNKVIANHSKIQEFNTVFYAHFAGGKIPHCFFWDLVNDAMEEEPDDLDAWILNYPSKIDYQKVDKLKVNFGDRVIDLATKATSNIVNDLNPLWNPVPSSGKSISDMLRAMKLQRFRAKAHHQNAIQSMHKQDGHLTGTWGDAEKLAYVRAVVEGKLDKYDPATKHPKHWLAFLLCSHPIDHFTGRRLSLTSCVPPAIGQPDNVDILPSSDLQRLEHSSIHRGAVVSKAPKKRGVQQAYSEAKSTASASSSSFTHTVQLVSQNKEDEELVAHIKKHVTSIKDAISTLENLDTAEYVEELGDLRKKTGTSGYSSGSDDETADRAV